jgi:hypothetical protein
VVLRRRLGDPALRVELVEDHVDAAEELLLLQHVDDRDHLARVPARGV